MPRRNRPRGVDPPGDGDDGDDRWGFDDLGPPAPAGWQVRQITAAGATKKYRCPTCERDITPNTSHIVAWPNHDPSQRRHFHTACWNLEVKRGPRRY